MKQKTKTEGTDRKRRPLLSLNQVEYESILEIFEQEVTQKLSSYTLKGKLRKRLSYHEQPNSSLYGAARKLKFMLMYMKVDVSDISKMLIFIKIIQK